MEYRDGQLYKALDQTFYLLDQVLQSYKVELASQEISRVIFVGHGTIRVEGLPGIRSQELVSF